MRMGLWGKCRRSFEQPCKLTVGVWHEGAACLLLVPWPGTAHPDLFEHPCAVLLPTLLSRCARVLWWAWWGPYEVLLFAAGTLLSTSSRLK